MLCKVECSKLINVNVYIHSSFVSLNTANGDKNMSL